jgi:hypothetical protein
LSYTRDSAALATASPQRNHSGFDLDQSFPFPRAPSSAALLMPRGKPMQMRNSRLSHLDKLSGHRHLSRHRSSERPQCRWPMNIPASPARYSWSKRRAAGCCTLQADAMASGAPLIGRRPRWPGIVPDCHCGTGNGQTPPRTCWIGGHSAARSDTPRVTARTATASR